MVKVVETPVGYATAALVFIFGGLVRADQGLSVAEIEKIEILVYKLQNGLPGNYSLFAKGLHAVHKDPDYSSWEPRQFADQGLQYMDRFVSSGEATTEHIETIQEAMELIMEVGNITEGEEIYMAYLRSEFKSRYIDTNLLQQS